MRFDDEVCERVGTASSYGQDDFAVVVYEPHGDRELITIAVDTPDGRRHDITAQAAADLAAALLRSAAALTRACEAPDPRAEERD